MLVYLDSTIIIYAVEGDPPFQIRAQARLAALRLAGDALAVSDLSHLECLVKPIRLGNTNLIAEFRRFLADPDLVRVPLCSAVYARATLIRAHHRFALGDSLHLAAAAEAGCDLFLTNDARLVKFSGLAVEILP